VRAVSYTPRTLINVGTVGHVRTVGHVVGAGGHAVGALLGVVVCRVGQ